MKWLGGDQAATIGLGASGWTAMTVAMVEKTSLEQEVAASSYEADMVVRPAIV
jgi:hypothetical protein